MVGLLLLGSAPYKQTIKKVTPTPTRTRTITPTRTPTITIVPTITLPPTETLVPSPTSVSIEPYIDAPACESHSNSEFHTLWNYDVGCHYDHEHGQNPFTQQVESFFPGFDLYELLGWVQIGHTNPSSPMENTHKHGGFKWDVVVPAPNGCTIGFESGEVAIDASVIQYHAFGDYSIEFESRVHSVSALMRQCKSSTPSDKGYIYVVQHVDYGQRVSGYQGHIIPYADNPQPVYNPGLAPYFSINCINKPAPPCGEITTREGILLANQNTNSVWTGKSGERVNAGTLLGLLFRVRDTYNLFDWNGHVFLWMCSEDGGLTYSALVGCRYNNSTTKLHEVQGRIPREWDNLDGFDMEPELGRITAEGFVTRFGILNPGCVEAGLDCHPIKMVRAFVGFYSTNLCQGKCANTTPITNPERDIYFCGETICSEASPGSASSGWIGMEN